MSTIFLKTLLIGYLIFIYVFIGEFLFELVYSLNKEEWDREIFDSGEYPKEDMKMVARIIYGVIWPIMFIVMIINSITILIDKARKR